MQIVNIAGALGRDAEFKTTQAGDQFCKFTVAVSTGWGDRKATTWWDVTKWGKGAEGLTQHLRKGSKVSVSGELSTREHEGKTYLQIRADHVTLQGDAGGARDTRDAYGADRQREAQRGHNEMRQTAAAGGGGGGFNDDLDDDLPFASNSIGRDMARRVVL